MPRPETAQDVLDFVRQSGLVGEPALGQFIARVSQSETRDALLALLIADGLLTRYQASELVSGQWGALRLGSYRVLDRLGKGAMSQVYLAEHIVLRKRVALKVLSVNLRDDKTARRRFVREARAASSIEHPNIVHVFDVDMDHDPPYLVMEFVDGISLQAAVAAYGTFSSGEAAAMGTEVARGLAVAAAVGLVHRDIKPANLLLDRKGGVKILDLGIVRVLDDDTLPPNLEEEEIVGTLDYLAPEQAENSSNVDPRADLYSLGATLYFLLAGHPPFPGTNLRHKLAAKQFSDPPPIHRLRPDVDPALSQVIQKLLARDLTQRYATAAATEVALAPFASLGDDFPSRFFRSLLSSTQSDDPRSQTIPSSPPTESIRRVAPGISRAKSQVSSTTENYEDPGPPTLRLSNALTDMTMEPLGEQLMQEAQKAHKSPILPGRSSISRHWLHWFAIVSACALATILIAYARSSKH